MQRPDRKRFALQMLALSEIYGKPISDAVADLWYMALERFPIEAVEAALARHIQSPDVGQWMPKPADVVRMIEGTSIDSAMVAWAKVDRAVRAVGPYATVAFDDPLIHRVVHDMGGWIGLGGKDLDEWPFIGNEFRTRYTAFRSRQEVPEYPAKLVGLTEADNGRKGYAVDEVTLIGDPEAAKRVLVGGTDKPSIGFQRIAAPDNVRRLPTAPRMLELAGEAT